MVEVAVKEIIACLEDVKLYADSLESLFMASQGLALNGIFTTLKSEEDFDGAKRYYLVVEGE